MKLTPSLWKQRIGSLIRRHWWIQRERKVLNTGVDSYLSSLGIQVKDPLQVESPPLPRFEYEREHLNPLKTLELKSLSIEKIPCLAFNDNNLLQEGTNQAQLLTKTIIMKDQFPEEITNLITSSSPGVNRLVQNIIYTSTIFDAHQEKLPKQKDPARPAWNFPRSYGITSIRKTRDLCKKLLQLCESLNSKYSRNRTVVNDGITSVFLEKESDLLRLALKMDLLLLSSKPLKPIKLYNLDEEFEFPNIYPMHHTISLNKSNVEEVEDQYPTHSESPWNNIHTLFVHTDQTTVQHLTGLPVTENQIHARTLMKSFTAAAMCARQKYGMDVKDLSEPIVVQCVETNGQRFHFSVFQLNTLNLDGTEGVKNYWWSSPNMQLYEVAEYQRAQPVLEGYNPQVFDTICAFL